MPPMPRDQDMVIFTRTFDLLSWLLPQCERFPKAQRFVVTQRLQGAALDFQEALFEGNAREGEHRLQHLQAADAHLNKLRLPAIRAALLVDARSSAVDDFAARHGTIIQRHYAKGGYQMNLEEAYQAAADLWGALGRLIGVQEQTVSLWEQSPECDVPETVDRLVRAIDLAERKPESALRELLDGLGESDARDVPIVAEKTARAWKASAA